MYFFGLDLFGLDIDWSSEQFIAVISLAAALVPLLALVLPSGRKRIVYRVPLDAPVSVAPNHVGSTFGLGIKVFREGAELANPSLVLIRVKNVGRRAVSWRDWEVPLYCSFGGRIVVAAEVTTARHESLIRRVRPRPAISEPENVDDEPDQEPVDTAGHVVGETAAVPASSVAPGSVAPGSVAPGSVVQGNGAGSTPPPTYVVTRPFGLNGREWFRLLILVAGHGEGVQVHGRIEDGRIVKEHTNRRPGSRIAVLTGTALALVGLAVGLLLFPSASDAGDRPKYCREGRLVGQGSTAFAGLMASLGEQYARDCPGATVEYTAMSSAQGVESLAGIDPAEAPRRIALSDGRSVATDGPYLQARPVAILVFAVVVNDQVGVRVKSLTKTQLQRIFTGKYTNWNSIVPGFDMPIRVVGRTSTSGTRRAFQSQILDGKTEQQPTSDNCMVRRDRRRTGGIRCERGDTRPLLAAVQQTRGAIGYAELGTASEKRYVATVQIDGVSPNAAAVSGDLYEFWTVEYLYTNGQPSSDSLVAGFLDFLSTPYATAALESDQHLTCTSEEVSQLCRANR
jgi:ABC-type phosphate transport system substrate-binding protein